MIYLSLTAMVLSSCGGTKKLTQARVSSNHELSENQVYYVLEHLRKAETHFEYLSAKGNAVVRTNGKTYHLKANFRMQDNHKIWLSLSASFGIEVARLLLTTDSVFYLNRLEHSYFVGGYNFISKMLNANVDFDMIQSLLTGRDVKWYDNQSLKVRTNDKLYQLESMNRRRLKRYAKQNEVLNPVFYQSVWLEPEHFKITKIKMKAHKQDDTKKIIINYDDFKVVEEQLIPFAYTLDIASQNPAAVNIKWKRIELNKKTLKFPFKLPKTYHPVK